MERFSKWIVPSVANLNDPDTIQYPIFVEFDALFLRALHMSHGKDDCPPAPITVFAVFERLLELLLSSSSDVWLLHTEGVFQAQWKNMSATTQLLRKILLDIVYQHHKGVKVHCISSLEQLGGLVLEQTPQIYITQDFTDFQETTSFLLKNIENFRDRFFYLECCYLIRGIAILTTNDLDIRSDLKFPIIELLPKMGKNVVIFVNQKRKLYWNPVTELTGNIRLSLSNVLEQCYSQIGDADVAEFGDENTPENLSNIVEVWSIHRTVLERISFEDRQFVLSVNYPKSTQTIIETISLRILTILDNSLFISAEFIDLYDPKILYIVANHMDEVKKAIEIPQLLSENLNSIREAGSMEKSSSSFLKKLAEHDVFLTSNEFVSTRTPDTFPNFFCKNISEQHWHNSRLLDDDYRLQAKNHRQLRSLQKEATYNQRFGESFKTASKFDKRLTITLNSCEQETAASKKKKGKKESSSAKVKQLALELAKEKEKEKSIKELNRIVKIADSKNSLKETVIYLEDEISKIVTDSDLELFLYFALCKRSSQLVEKEQSLDSKVRLFTTARDLWRFHQFRLDPKEKDTVMAYFLQLNMHGLVERLSNENAKPTNDDQSVDFQLEYCGHLLPRKTYSVHDDRVSKFFVPDRWQVGMLDAVDERKSILVSAPTSSGKTFVSYYCISKILDSKKKIVFVVPTKALVNQIRADIYNRYGRIYAVFTRDERNDNCMTAQVLITVPQVLETLLLSPEGRKWAESLHYGILDEIHSIDDKESGSCWERILALIPCPVICLSATIGNFPLFSEWLNKVQVEKGYKLHIVLKSDRWNDLVISQYTGTQNTAYNPSSEFWQLDKLNKSSVNMTNFSHFHPMSLFTTPNGWMLFKTQNSLQHIQLTPKQSNELFATLKRLRKEFNLNIDSIDPKHFFKETPFLDRNQVHDWSSKLKQYLCGELNPVQIKRVFSELPSGHVPVIRGEMDRFFNLLVELDCSDRLPAIAFVLNNNGCRNLAFHCLRILRRVEESQKKAVAVEKHRRVKTKKKTVSKDEEDIPEDDIETIHRKHAFKGKISLELDNYWINRLLYKTNWDAKNEYILALQFGIGIHHGAMPKVYRDCVEALFREGKLRVVIATSTLAMGINMPCRTVIICQDSKFLSPLMYQQMAGRAGRRGFDSEGHVVFFETPLSKLSTLICSPLPELRGNSTFTTSTVLRFANLYHSVDAKIQESVIQALSLLLRIPLSAYSQKSNKDIVSHRLAFSCGLLQTISIVDQNLKPIASSAMNLLERLHYHDPANLILLLLLNSSELMDYIESIPSTIEASENLMGIFCHLFNRRKLPHQYVRLEGCTNIQLPKLAPGIAKRINEWNALLEKELHQYLVMQLQHKPNFELPLSKLSLPYFTNRIESSLSILLHSTTHHQKSVLQHPFVAIRGTPDSEASPIDYVLPIQAPVFVEDSSLNNYALLFYKHGSMKTLARENKMPDHGAWDVLKDWSLCLRSMRECMKPDESKFGQVVTLMVEQFTEHFSKTQ
ncbi:putative ATP-dependent RNA helicase ddx60 [Boothiomyces macroporosus]|uniref:ATP-dependent RNA helicase ddx60 n=1 Tax=Boothiomyces macroporosus TaxID=261099 RepID=A0AAD5ULD5_9FUNG|nr:putative ATP-dependent RNA helicase ddx60 [Boothiomyces macroporosus]